MSRQAGKAVLQLLPEKPAVATPVVGTALSPEEGSQQRSLGTEPCLMGAVEPQGGCSGDSDPTRRASVPGMFV